MAYINKTELQKIIKGSPAKESQSDIAQALINRGHIVQGYNDQEQMSFGKGLIKEIAKPFVRGYNLLKTAAPAFKAVAQAAPAAIGLGDKERATQRIIEANKKIEEKQKQTIDTKLGRYTPITSMRESIGTGVELSSYLIGGKIGTETVKSLIKGRLGRAMATSALGGAIGGGVYGAGSALSDDKKGSQVVGGALAGTLAGGAVGGAIGGLGFGGSAIIKQAQKRLQPVAERTKTEVVNYINKAIKPRLTNLTVNQLKKVQDKQVQAFQVLLKNKGAIKLPDETGALVSRLPKTLAELSESINSVKVSLFNQYDKLAREAGERGAYFNPIETITNLQKVAKDKSFSPELRKYANKIIPEVKELKGENPLVVQNRIKELNESLAGYFSGRVEKGKARIDASVAKLLNNELDDVISNFGGNQWKGLRNEFSSLKTIEKDVIRQAIIQAKKASKGLTDMTDIFTGGDLVSGIITLDPTRAVKGVAGKAIQEIYKKINSPENYLKKIFKLLENPKLK